MEPSAGRLKALQSEVERLTHYLTALPPDAWNHPSACARWQVVAEAVQTVMRKCGHAQPYEQVKALTRGRTVTREALSAFIHSLDLPEDDKARLLHLTPATYTGRASQLVRYIYPGVMSGRAHAPEVSHDPTDHAARS